VRAYGGPARAKSVAAGAYQPRGKKDSHIGGGGRCNFTNLHLEADNYLSDNPHFCKSALSRFSQYDFLALVEKHGVAYHQKTLGQLFCHGRSNEIVNLLLKECSWAGVSPETNCTVEKIAKTQHFLVSTNLGAYTAESLVIATGGLSIPKIGATCFGYDIARQFGLKVLPCRPGLTPFTLSKKTMADLGTLAGISVEAVVTCRGQSFKEAILFTHKGLSGPAILQISNYWQPGDELEIDLLPNTNLGETIKQWQQDKPGAELKNLLATLLSKRLAHRLVELLGLNKAVYRYSDTDIDQIAQSFHRWRVKPAGTQGYQKAEVTQGGVDTAELSSKTFEARQIPGLYFVGEVIDVIGWLGGYNLQWAWLSGYCAGLYV
jgi:hypothetical protein